MLSKKPAVESELLLDNCGAITTGFSIIQQKGRKNRLVHEGFTLKRRKGVKGSPASSMSVNLSPLACCPLFQGDARMQHLGHQSSTTPAALAHRAAITCHGSLPSCCCPGAGGSLQDTAALLPAPLAHTSTASFRTRGGLKTSLAFPHKCQHRPSQLPW